jgi:peptidoglycan/xylan/chitin deacetylase (PgdA/CDA1 family)
MYHEISPRADAALHKYVVSPRAFQAQMRWLSRAGYRPIGLDALSAASDGGPPLPPSAVVITFDDGYRDCLDYSTEILSRFGFPATFFIVAGRVGQMSRWLSARGALERPLASWPMVRSLRANGFECGAHGLTHVRLADVPEDSCRDELHRSRVLLEEQIGQPVVHVAYPYGSCNSRVRAFAADAGYRTGCTVEAAIADDRDDLLLLPRVSIEGGETLADFISRLRTARSLRDHWSRLRRRWRPRAVLSGRTE